MTWPVLLFFLVLGLPLLGALLTIPLRRLASRQVVVLVAALTLFLAATGVILIAEVNPPEADLEALLLLPSAAPAAPPAVPTPRWVQPPRTLALTATIVLRTPTPTPSPPPSPTPNPLSEIRVAVRNGVGTAGLATRVANRLEQEGFQVVEVENDRRVGERPNTLILDKGDHPEARQVLADILNVAPAFIETHSEEPGDVDIIVIVGDDFEE